uniref:Uncharacterized protein MANES_15G069800 n=1 Tax=Rhizophora mucronata TaxID=61149 RepID=A0A2P2K9T1_RHIMU
MASNREETVLLYTITNNPSSQSSPITVSDHLDPTFLTTEQQSSQVGSSASNSFQNDTGFLLQETIDAEFGFSRPDFRQSPLAGTVQFYERHVFLCYKNPSVWPPRIEAAEFDRLPRLLSASVMARKGDMKRVTRLTICEGHDGTETSNGDVLIFPDMIRYRRLTHFDVDTFVEEVLVKDSEWLPGTPEKLEGSYVFVCSHSSRDRRCGVCGPAVISRFKEEIELHGLLGKVSVRPCSHISGHKYAGNVIIFGSSIGGIVSGHWYGYVSPDGVPVLIEQHIVKGDIVDWLWRGQMGLSEEEQIASQELRLQPNGETDVGKNINESTLKQTDEKNAVCKSSEVEARGCCQQNENSLCCQASNLPEKDNPESSDNVVETSHEKKSGLQLLSQFNSGKSLSARKIHSLSTWSESWEREDTYAALAVVCAVVSVAVAYSYYKQLR